MVEDAPWICRRGRFATGLFSRDAWQGDFIGGSIIRPSTPPSGFKYPYKYASGGILRHDFALENPHDPPRSALAFMAATGIAELLMDF